MWGQRAGEILRQVGTGVHDKRERQFQLLGKLPRFREQEVAIVLVALMVVRHLLLVSGRLCWRVMM